MWRVGGAVSQATVESSSATSRSGSQASPTAGKGLPASYPRTQLHCCAGTWRSLRGVLAKVPPFHYLLQDKALHLTTRFSLLTKLPTCTPSMLPTQTLVKIKTNR